MTTNDTNDLIAGLARDLAPVRPLRRPSRRAAAWLLGAAVYAAALALYAGGPSVVALAASAADARVWLPQLAAVVVAALAALAAFASVIPGHSRNALVAAAVAALVWIGTLAAAGPPMGSLDGASAVASEWECVALILAGSAPLLAVLAATLRRGAPLDAALTLGLAGVAAGTLVNVVACVSRAHPDNHVTLAWHGGTILALALVCALGARFVLRWRTAKHS